MTGRVFHQELSRMHMEFETGNREKRIVPVFIDKAHCFLIDHIRTKLNFSD